MPEKKIIASFYKFIDWNRNNIINYLLNFTNNKIKFNLLYDNNSSLQKKIKIEQLKKETS